MIPKEFEDYLVALSDEEHDALIQERIKRLNTEQQVIAQARELVNKERHRLIIRLSSDPNTNEMVFNALRDMDSNDNCEHGISIWKDCSACNEIDYLMFPELFNADGSRIDEKIG